ncbi:MAG: HEAT repeat domain-containing protein [Bacteroidetes bacterium]|nr:HEAT repeat domain-containing protein [Bacteroidota bacterium]
MKATVDNKIGIDVRNLTPDVRKQVPDLMNDKTMKRKNARHFLEEKGERVLEDIYLLLKSGNHQLRWEAAKALEDIASEKSIPVLIKLMNDKESEFRWLAAEGLRKIGRKSIVPLLQLVIEKGQSPRIRTGAHYVLNEVLTDVEKLEMENLMEALGNYYETGETAPVWASEAINYFSKGLA